MATKRQLELVHDILETAAETAGGWGVPNAYEADGWTTESYVEAIQSVRSFLELFEDDADDDCESEYMFSGDGPVEKYCPKDHDHES